MTSSRSLPTFLNFNRPELAMTVTARRFPVLLFMFGGIATLAVGTPLLLGATSPLVVAASACAIATLCLWLPAYPIPLSQVFPFWWDAFLEERRPREFARITAVELAVALQRTPESLRPTVIDCRLTADFKKGHIPGAINVPFFEVARRASSLAAQHRSVVVHCYFGYYSPVASRKFMRGGALVSDLVGGFESWKGELELGGGGSSEVASENSAIYMDNHATTALDPRVLAAMMPYLTTQFGNAASVTHRFGSDALDAVEHSRALVAQAIGARAGEIVFTSGATESNNLAIKGAVQQGRQHHQQRRVHVVTCAIEHSAVLDVCSRLAAGSDVAVTVVPVGADGRVSVDAVRRAITDDTALVSIMTANNEIGVIQPIAEIGAVCRARGVLFHTDAAQALGRVPLDVDSQCIDLLSISAHKVYGPKGVGALFVRDGVKLRAEIDGGGHEAGRRSGTLNVPGIVGLGHACALAHQLRDTECAAVAALRDRLQARLVALPGVQVTGSLQHRLPGTLHVTVRGVQSSALLSSLASCVAISAGAACSSAASSTKSTSHVLAAIGIDAERAQSALRFGLGRFNTRAQVDRVAQEFEAAMKY
jgi:cysteine desulfurase